MSGIFGIEAGELVITKDSRTVLTTAGTLVNLLPDTYDISATLSVSFPDFTKDYLYNHWWISDYNGGSGTYGMDNGCATWITVPPQEWSATSTIVAAPSGCDFIALSARINRTVAPTTTWGGNSVDVLPKANQWIPFTGSVLVEAEVGMARAFSIYIDSGNLVLHRQQSVSIGPGGFGAYGSVSPANLADSTGGSNGYGSAAGIPVAGIESKSDPGYVYSGLFPSKPDSNVQGGLNPCSTSLSTNFASTYSVEIVGKWGRRS